MSCSSSNPLQELSKHTSVDRSLQHDQIQTEPKTFHGGNFRNQVINPHLNNEFNKFLYEEPPFSSFVQNSVSQGLNSQDFVPQKYHSRVPIQNNIYEKPDDWTYAFRKMNLEQSHSLNEISHSNWTQEFVATNKTHINNISNTFHSHSIGNYTQRPLNQQIYNVPYDHHNKYQYMNESKTVQDEAFEKAFDSLKEHNDSSDFLQSESDKSSKVENHKYKEQISKNSYLSDQNIQQQKDFSSENQEEFASIARKIVHSLEDADKSKFQNSKFMNLMQKIGNAEVKIDRNKLINSKGQDVQEVEENNEIQELQKEIKEVNDTQEPQEFHEILKSQETHVNKQDQETHKNKQDQDQEIHSYYQYTTQDPESILNSLNENSNLDDPLVYIDQEAARRALKFGHTLEEEKLNFYSPFNYAKKFGPKGIVHISNWEENYDF